MIDVEHDDSTVADPAERCCFCRVKTRFWYTPNDVACCPDCAHRAKPEDVPDKKTWMRRERIAEGE